MFPDQNEILYYNQYGFNYPYSDWDNWKNKCLANKHYACVVFIDLTKNHITLLVKLKYGSIGITNNWFKYFLQDRYQYTNIIKDCSSEKLLITSGVSIGSVLRPLPFLLYILT